MAARRAMIFMEELGLRRAIFEGDSETVVKALLGDWPDRSCIGHIVKDCKSLMGCFQTCSYSHVRWQSNGVAHALARRARKSSPLFVWMESVPPDISYLGYVWIGRKTHILRLAFFLLFFFFFTHVCGLVATVHALCMNSSRKIWLFSYFSANQDISCTVHGPTNFTFQQFFN